MHLKMTKFRNQALRVDNRTEIPGVHKFVYTDKKPVYKKRLIRPDKWIVQFRTRYICISTDFVKAVKRRLEAEVRGRMYLHIEESPAYRYLKQHNSLEV